MQQPATIMSDSLFYGHKPSGLFWLLLRSLSLTHTRGILGIRTTDAPDWFWIHNGFVTFAWHEGEDDHLFERLIQTNLLTIEQLVAFVHRFPTTTPSTFIQNLPQSVTSARAWDNLWNEYYIHRLRCHLQAADDLYFVWYPFEWNPHPRMVALDVREWVRQSLQQTDSAVPILQTLKTDDFLLYPPAAPPDHDPMTLKIYDRLVPGGPSRKTLPHLTANELNLLWFYLWDGIFQIQPPARETIADEDVFEQLMAYYARALTMIADYLQRELGDLAKPLLQKNVAHIVASYPLFFHSLQPHHQTPSFDLNEVRPILKQLLIRNETGLEEIGNMLEDLLMLHLLSIRNVLGAHHYTTLVEMLQMMRKTPRSPLPEE